MLLVISVCAGVMCVGVLRMNQWCLQKEGCLGDQPGPLQTCLFYLLPPSIVLKV